MKGHIFKLVAAMLWMFCHAAYAGTHHYYYTDPQGTVLAKADANGTIIATYDYAPYGTAVASMSPAPNGPGYTGHVNDPDTGLVYMQARYYDPVVGRFLSVDPIGPSPGSLFHFNRYDYANDNPIANIDPDGRDILVIAGGRNVGSWNGFGHVDSSVQGYGMASYGNDTRLGSSTTKYIQSQSALRNQTITLTTTTPAQDAKATQYIKSTLNQNTATLVDNCAVKTNLIVNASGVATKDIPFPGGTSRDVSSLPGAKTYFIPRNGQIPKDLQHVLTRFNPPAPPRAPPPPPPPPPPTPHQNT